MPPVTVQVTLGVVAVPSLSLPLTAKRWVPPGSSVALPGEMLMETRVAWPDVWCGRAQNWGGYCNRLTQRDLKQTDLIVEPRRTLESLGAAKPDVRLTPGSPLRGA